MELTAGMLLKLRNFFSVCCLVLGVAQLGAAAQTGSAGADDWDALRGHRNIFALRDALETDLPVSDGVHALGVAYIAAFSRDFRTADQNLAYARNYAIARRDDIFAEAVETVASVVMREQGRFHALAERIGRGRNAGSTWHRIIQYRAKTLSSAYISAPEFVLKNISPDKSRIVVPALLGGVPGTLLFDTGAEHNLLSDSFASDYGARRSGVRFSMLTVDGERSTQLAELNSVELGPARFDGVIFGVQAGRDGVIGFFLNQGATGILGFPLVSRFGEVVFEVSSDRISQVVLKRPAGLDGAANTRPNMMLREDKPYIKVMLEDEVYSCIFDTGAPRSLFSGAIIARHQDGLGLETLTARAARRNGFIWKDGAVRYIKTVPVRTGYRGLDLRNVQVFDGGGPASDFCVIGLDAVISSGGARMNLDTLQIQFGGNNSPRYREFNLR